MRVKYFNFNPKKWMSIQKERKFCNQDFSKEIDRQITILTDTVFFQTYNISKHLIKF